MAVSRTYWGFIPVELFTDSSIAHFDETGMRIEGKLHWRYVAGTNELTYYMPHQKRGSIATDAIGILPNYRGKAVHGCWKSFFNYSCEHAQRNAHHNRELTFIYEQYAQKWTRR
jgi:transposase